jgi:hypothetical protein
MKAVVILGAVLLAALASACGGGSSDDLSILSGGSASPTPSASLSLTTTPSASPSASPTVTVTTTPTSTPSTTPTGGTGGMTADEFSTYLDDVQPSYEQIAAAETAILNAIQKVDSGQISYGQGARRIDTLGMRLDPPVTQLAVTTVPAALEKAHAAWLDGIYYDAQAYVRIGELMADGTYQRTTVDPQVEALFKKADANIGLWRGDVASFETELGVSAPWTWPAD